MQWIIDFLKQLFEIVASLIDFLVTAVMGLLSIVGQLPTLLNTVTNVASGLPTILAGFVGATLTISIIYLLLGRGQGGN